MRISVLLCFPVSYLLYQMDFLIRAILPLHKYWHLAFSFLEYGDPGSLATELSPSVRAARKGSLPRPQP